MLVQNSRSTDCRRGVAVVLIVVSLVALVSVLAVSLEGGLLLTERRNAQATADAAALAAAADLYYLHYVNYGLDAGGTAKAAALYTAKLNGYDNDGVNTIITVNIPPKSGDYVGRASYVEVIVEYYHTRGFSSIFGIDKVPVRGRTVAVGKPAAAEVGILVLDPSVKSAFNAGGGGQITVNKVPVMVNSTSQEGSIANGGSVITAPQYYLTGNYTTAGGGVFLGPIQTGTTPANDPLKHLPVPNPSTMTIQSRHKTQYTSGEITLDPGVYKGGISASSTASIKLNPGIYYMDGGGFSFTGQGSLWGEGVMIYNSPAHGSADTVSLAGQGLVHMTPPTSGAYKGVLLFQDRTSTVPATVSGGANMNIVGTFYFANALLKVSGTGDFINAGSQYVSRTLDVQGGGKLYLDWDPNKVAQQRLITIVE